MLKGDNVPENQHFLNLGANEVATGSFELIGQNIAEGIEMGEITLISGPAGVGKTFAVRSALHSIGPDSGIDPSTILRELRFRATPSPRVIAERITRSVTGIEYDFRTEREYTDRLLEALETPTVLFIDEAQYLSPVGMHYLRFLFDEQATKLSLVLAGGPSSYRQISTDAMLRSRVGSHVPLERLTPDEVLEYMPHLHPLLKNAPAKLIAAIDDQFAHGIFRAWIKFLRKAERVCVHERVSTLTPEISDRVMNKIGDLEEDDL